MTSLNYNKIEDYVYGKASKRVRGKNSPLFTQLFIHAQINENIKAPRHCPLCGEFSGGRWIPCINGR